MWKMYDQLIEEIPSTWKIKEITQSKRWTIVNNDRSQGVGAAMNFSEPPITMKKKYLGCSLQDIAELIKSWDFQEASLGLAAINSYYNQEQLMNTHFPEKAVVRKNKDAFEEIPELTMNQKVGMVGHFPYIDRFPEYRKKLTVFELNPRTGDYPASASEFLLPEMAIVYITASTFVNKTLPRLLELSENARTIVVGASCPFSPSLFDSSIDSLAGTVYRQTTTELIKQKEQTGLPLSKYGAPMMITRRKRK